MSYRGSLMCQKPVMVNPNEVDELEPTNQSKNVDNESFHNGSINEEPKITFVETSIQTETSHTDGLVLSKNDTLTLRSPLAEIPGPSSSVIERIQVDAVHPFFEGYRSRRKTVGTSTEEDQTDLYYCPPCRTYLHASVAAVVDHFKNNYHKAVKFCIYCGGPVYVYEYQNNQELYHKCINDESDCNSSLKFENNNNDIDKVQKN